MQSTASAVLRATLFFVGVFEVVKSAPDFFRERANERTIQSQVPR